MKEVWILCLSDPISDVQLKIIEKTSKCRLILVESIPSKVTIDCKEGIILDGVFQETPCEIEVSQKSLINNGKLIGKMAFIGWEEK